MFNLERDRRHFYCCEYPVTDSTRWFDVIANSMYCSTLVNPQNFHQTGSLKYSFILTMLLIIWMLMVMKWETVKGRRADYWKHRIFPCRQPIPLLLLSHISSNISWIFCFRFSYYFPSDQTIHLSSPLIFCKWNNGKIILLAP